MSNLVHAPADRVTLHQVDAHAWRIAVDGRVFGPAMTKRAATVVKRWLQGGALEDLRGEGGSKLEQVFGDVDRAIDSVGDLLRNGLRR